MINFAHFSQLNQEFNIIQEKMQLKESQAMRQALLHLLNAFIIQQKNKKVAFSALLGS